MARPFCIGFSITPGRQIGSSMDSAGRAHAATSRGMPKRAGAIRTALLLLMGVNTGLSLPAFQPAAVIAEDLAAAWEALAVVEVFMEAAGIVKRIRLEMGQLDPGSLWQIST